MRINIFVAESKDLNDEELDKFKQQVIDTIHHIECEDIDSSRNDYTLDNILNPPMSVCKFIIHFKNGQTLWYKREEEYGFVVNGEGITAEEANCISYLDAMLLDLMD